MLKRLCVFCGSSEGRRPEYAMVARTLGATLAQRNIGLVYGGARRGLMGALADKALAGGGEVIGVMPRALVDREVSHTGLSELRIVESMHERKAVMTDLADAFIALPGGWGTLDEFAEALTWAQLGIHAKPLALLNVAGYYDSLLGFFDAAVENGFLPAAHRALLLEESDPVRLLNRLIQEHPPGDAETVANGNLPRPPP